MCIYYGNSSNLSYTSQEHVLPAAFGCHTKLEKGVVSDQANEYFSPIERRVIEQSMLQIPRIIEGPGKRGSLSPSKATTSDVSRVKINGKVSLGYMKGTAAFILDEFIISEYDLKSKGKITHCQFLKGSGPIIYDDKTDNKEVEKVDIYTLQKNLSKWGNKYKFVKINDDKIHVTYFKDKVYIGYKRELDEREINVIKESLQQNLVVGACSNVEVGQPKLTLEISHKYIDVYILVAKSAVNTLAFLKSGEYVRNLSEIDELKSMILKEDDSIMKRVKCISDAKKCKCRLHLDDDVHACILIRQDKQLNGYVFFYDYGFIITMSDDSSVDIEQIDGIVCNWKNEKDYTYIEYLNDKGLLTSIEE